MKKQYYFLEEFKNSFEFINKNLYDSSTENKAKHDEIITYLSKIKAPTQKQLISKSSLEKIELKLTANSQSASNLPSNVENVEIIPNFKKVEPSYAFEQIVKPKPDVLVLDLQPGIPYELFKSKNCKFDLRMMMDPIFGYKTKMYMQDCILKQNITKIFLIDHSGETDVKELQEICIYIQKLNVIYLNSLKINLSLM